MIPKILLNIYNIRYSILGYIIAIIAVICMFVAINKCSKANESRIQNIIALTDSIEYYKNKQGELIASKTLLSGEFSDLKYANDSLYNVIKNMHIYNPSSVLYINSTIDNQTHDTTWIIKSDTANIPMNVSKEFAFNDEYRTLEGSVFCKDSILGLNIDKDKVYLDYSIAIENGKVYVKSNNPYIQYNKIQGITIPKTKPKWSIGIGPQIGYGYDYVAKKSNPYIGVGVSLQYNLLSW